MTLPRILSHQSLRVRIERLLRAQRIIRKEPGTSAQRIEIAKAIAELHSGYPTAHTEMVERWAAEYLGGLS